MASGASRTTAPSDSTAKTATQLAMDEAVRNIDVQRVGSSPAYSAFLVNVDKGLRGETA